MAMVSQLISCILAILRAAEHYVKRNDVGISWREELGYSRAQ